MSAAEKLKALRETALDALEDLSGDAGWAHAYQPGGEDASDRAPDVRVILDALPQIVAVLEAAETNLVIYDAALIAAGMNTTPNRMLAAALTALDEALGDVT